MFPFSVASCWICLWVSVVAAEQDQHHGLAMRNLRSHTSMIELEFSNHHPTKVEDILGIEETLRSYNKEKEQSKSSTSAEKKLVKVSKLQSSKATKLSAPLVNRTAVKKSKEDKKEAYKLVKSEKRIPKSSKIPSHSGKGKPVGMPKGCRRLDSKSHPGSAKKSKSERQSSKHEMATFHSMDNSTAAEFGSATIESASKSSKGKHDSGKVMMVEDDDDYVDDMILVDCATIVPDETPVPISTPAPTPTSTFPPFATEAITETDQIIVLQSYHLFLGIQQTRIPLLTDYEPLTEMVDEYLDRYFGSILSTMPPQVQFKGSSTDLSGSQFRLSQPVRLDFTTSLSFSVTSLLPEETELQAYLAGAFEGVNGENFAKLIVSDIDPDNIFATTSSVAYGIAVSTRTQRIAAGFAMYALNATLIVLAVVAIQFKRKRIIAAPVALRYGKGIFDHLTLLGHKSVYDERTVISATSMHEIVFSGSSESSGSEDDSAATKISSFRIVGDTAPVNGLTARRSSQEGQSESDDSSAASCSLKARQR